MSALKETSSVSREPVVRIGARSISHTTLSQRAAVAATGLARAGVAHGDRIAIGLRNDPEFLMLSTAAGLLGAVPVPINWHWRNEELRHVLGDSDARLAFAHSNFCAELERVLPTSVPLIEVPLPEEQLRAYGDAPVTGNHPLLDDWLNCLHAYSEPTQNPPLSLIYTSGTTGLPKGVLREPLPPEQARRVATTTLAAMGLGPGMSSIITAPMYHSAPNTQAVLALFLGIDLTIMPRFDPEDFLRLVSEQRISHAQMVPTMFVRLLALRDQLDGRYDSSSLEAIVHAAAPCPIHVKKQMIDWFGPVVREYYGGTELGIAAACDSEQWLAHEGTVGKPIPGADIRILDAENGNTLSAGGIGQVFVRPPDFVPGFTYLGRPEQRTEVEREGYLSLGDLGFLDGDGYLYLCDRARDIVISGGVNIYPAEIEACLLEFDGVRDAAVFGIPDEEFGEALAAHVEAEEGAAITEDSIRQHVRSRLAGYKVPRVIVFDDHLPREDTGKIFKRRIRDQYWRQAGRAI
jgi:long-chain acyl-CoA synthetase